MFKTLRIGLRAFALLTLAASPLAGAADASHYRLVKHLTTYQLRADIDHFLESIVTLNFEIKEIKGRCNISDNHGDLPIPFQHEQIASEGDPQTLQSWMNQVQTEIDAGLEYRRQIKESCDLKYLASHGGIVFDTDDYLLRTPYEELCGEQDAPCTQGQKAAWSGAVQVQQAN